MDSYCIPGSEGGGVFDHTTGALIALLTPPIRRRDGTAILNLALPVSPILPDIARVVTNLSGAALAIQKGPDVISEVIQSLVLISLGSTWASGVIISPQGCTPSCSSLYRFVFLSPCLLSFPSREYSDCIYTQKRNLE